MTAISVTKARENIYQILSDVNNNSQPITITNNRGKNGVLISEDDWNAIQETLYLNSIPDMAKSIIEAGEEPLEECSVYDPDEEWKMYIIRFSKQADKDKKLLKQAGLGLKAKSLLNIIARNPFQNPSPYEGLV